MPAKRDESRHAFPGIRSARRRRRFAHPLCGQALQRFEKPLCEVRVSRRHEPDFGEFG